MAEPNSPLRGRLIAVILGLLLVGFISGTPLRHVVQVLPACIALIVVGRRASWAQYASLAIFNFWIFIMALIWLHLLGIAHLINGDFSKPEIILTIFIAGWCLFGSLMPSADSSAVKLGTRVIAYLAFSILQIASLWLSFQPYFAHR